VFDVWRNRDTPESVEMYVALRFQNDLIMHTPRGWILGVFHGLWLQNGGGLHNIHTITSNEGALYYGLMRACRDIRRML
jgi:hypothetical protein